MKATMKTEIQIPKGYALEDLLDFDDSDFDEEATVCEEVTLSFGTDDRQE